MPDLSDLKTSSICQRQAARRRIVSALVDEPGEVKTFNLPYFLSLNHVRRIYRGHPGQWKPLELLL
jgi:hypothetical protein